MWSLSLSSLLYPILVVVAVAVAVVDVPLFGQGRVDGHESKIY